MKRLLSLALTVLVLCSFFVTSHESLVTVVDAACTQAIPNSFKQEILQGAHTSGNTYKIALYTQAAASLSASTTVYTGTGEIANGNGYTTGGTSLSGFNVTLSGSTAILDWTTDPTWPASTITADCFLIYNSTNGNKAVYVGTFTSTSSTNGTFTVVFPTPDSSLGLIRIN